MCGDVTDAFCGGPAMSLSSPVVRLAGPAMAFGGGQMRATCPLVCLSRVAARGPDVERSQRISPRESGVDLVQFGGPLRCGFAAACGYAETLVVNRHGTALHIQAAAPRAALYP